MMFLLILFRIWICKSNSFQLNKKTLYRNFQNNATKIIPTGTNTGVTPSPSNAKDTNRHISTLEKAAILPRINRHTSTCYVQKIAQSAAIRAVKW